MTTFYFGKLPKRFNLSLTIRLLLIRVKNEGKKGSRINIKLLFPIVRKKTDPSF